MSRPRNTALLVGLILSVNLIAVSLTTLFLSDCFSRAHARMLGAVCQEITRQYPETRTAFLSALKTCQSQSGLIEEENPLLSLGYAPADFLRPVNSRIMLLAALGFVAGTALFLLLLLLWRKRESFRIRALTDYLEKVNTGGADILFPVGEDDFSRLQDEIYKTVTQLRQTREEALKSKHLSAENLYNIAHQLKTPITAISLSVQMMEEQMMAGHLSPEYLRQISLRLARLTRLEEALLLLSRIDSGTLPLDQKPVDVFTLLSLAADNLQELLSKARVSVQIPESGEMLIQADPDWTIEAVMNLLKNCMEHTPPGGSIGCSYEQNPIFTRILLWDEGPGFAREDLPHLFERFYRGKNAGSGGIGIGLSLSRAIIESQNGTVTARNRPGGGALFEIHFYSH